MQTAQMECSDIFAMLHVCRFSPSKPDATLFVQSKWMVFALFSESHSLEFDLQSIQTYFTWFKLNWRFKDSFSLYGFMWFYLSLISANSIHRFKGCFCIWKEIGMLCDCKILQERTLIWLWDFCVFAYANKEHDSTSSLLRGSKIVEQHLQAYKYQLYSCSFPFSQKNHNFLQRSCFWLYFGRLFCMSLNDIINDNKNSKWFFNVSVMKTNDGSIGWLKHSVCSHIL